MAKESSNWGLSTRCVHAGTFEDTMAGGVNTPIFASSAFQVPGPTGRVVYPRYQNIPGQVAVAQKIAALENAQAGIVVSSGMAAISSIFLAFCQTGDHVVLQSDLYGGTLGLAQRDLPRRGIDVSWVDSHRIEEFEAALRPKTRLIYVETPSNPLMKILDLEALARMAQARGVLTVVDNTFATPINQNPLDLGIDIVVHSGTKYLNGHSDLCCGALACRSTLMETIAPVISLYGPSLSPYDCFLLERGLKTLALRMARHNQNAMAVASYLAQDSRVARVYYPGLTDHPKHAIAARQMRGFGGMLSFEPKGNAETAHRVMERFTLFKPAVSLGGVESLACFPVETSHASVPPNQREKMGIRDNLIRLSVGIEDTEDLLKDLDRALQATV
ncbi:trans-sulfuration enzyme family protein [Desulfosoma caldarium]|uniref:L-methionine gamma-lyase n=1 Tax=Desulfosoma caldarium TaxID=610254 RepID=A0A3N1VKH0_9BACT|nr:PLP-dependent aspartate aminotransferase family protein [Desulfosoma caldarium]ROR03305.1 cystathionine beta-lyase [Desulfosoma caldarium]